MLFTLALLCVLASIRVPNLLAAVDRSRGAAAARYLASRMALARARAVGRSTMVALRFEVSSSGTAFSVVQDGNGDGVRTPDIDQAMDRVIEAPVLLSDLFRGASIGRAPGTPVADALGVGGHDDPVVHFSGHLKLDHPRQLALMHALVRFAHIAAGDTFTPRDLHEPTATALDTTIDHYRLASLRL